jgi:RNA polymerase sigma-70 factor (ECF subfamily)
MTCEQDTGEARALRFREAALPCLDDAYRFAGFLLRNRADAEDAVQQCYLRALQHFDSWRGPAIKPWLLAILRNVCHSQMARRGRDKPVDPADGERPPLWQQPQALPDSALLEREQGTAIRRLVADLPDELRETIVLREFNDLTYREIAEVAGVPLGTVMSRLARARALLLARWKATDGGAGGRVQRNPPHDATAAPMISVDDFSR